MNDAQLETTLAAAHARLQVEGLIEASHIVRTYPARALLASAVTFVDFIAETYRHRQSIAKDTAFNRRNAK